MNSVLLDTSFLITLSVPERPDHTTALNYYRACVERRVVMYLSTIVISEFQVRQVITDLPLRNFIVLPFNIDHAMACGAISRQLSRDAADDRVRVKDDFKLIAQCECEGITHLLTADNSTLAKYLRRLQPGNPAATQPVQLSTGFDMAWFNGGQAPLDLA